MRKSVVLAFSLFALVPMAVQGQSDLLGDKDCFGTGDACLEDGVTWLSGAWGSVTQDGSDPSWQDIVINTSSTQSWTHTSVGTVTAATLTFRTAGIADIAGPYDVFVDGVSVGQMPFDASSHVLVETFSFAIDPLALADGVILVSFTPDLSDSWAIDYSELTYTAAVPEPASILLMASGFLGLVGVRVRRRS